ncbi:hypothetical protein [Oleiagrimonas soli]|uniref:Uncharacterized protein n=1 Tax=Oleiagrimonas soli TaxID=1543381 RepID=A0A099D0H0_9GAMM|nr:hypothetical protein [Oleiagrimonas soli]KGI78780.1 hypothetical protein LF63_0102165 [Oleiagrimonas soli]MBB6184453.1 hypothetical protein [Oleiagrimonas soli]
MDRETFDLAYLHKTMRELFPKRSDCASMDDLAEMMGELHAFSITTRLQLRLFLKKHPRELIEIGREPPDAGHQRMYRESMGDENYLGAIRQPYGFYYPGLIRIAMEIEFGAACARHDRARDPGHRCWCRSWTRRRDPPASGQAADRGSARRGRSRRRRRSACRATCPARRNPSRRRDA